jgi:hypothetical protein
MNQYTQGWSHAEDEQLYDLWMVRGLSCSQIGAIMGRTRNAIIGRCHRKGWKKPTDTQTRILTGKIGAGVLRAPKIERKTGRGNAMGSAAARAIGQRKSGAHGKEAVDLKGADVLSPNAKPWLERKARQCAYPVSGEGADTWSCCNPTDGDAYCAGHARLMISPNVSRKVNPSDLGASSRKPKERNSIFSSWLEDAA